VRGRKRRGRPPVWDGGRYFPSPLGLSTSVPDPVAFLSGMKGLKGRGGSDSLQPSAEAQKSQQGWGLVAGEESGVVDGHWLSE
jgi:hypothetical protein